MANEWKEITVRLRYCESPLTPGGHSRCEPSTVQELVEEIDRSMNASHFGGQIELTIINSISCSACADQGDVPCPGPYGKGCGDGAGCSICYGWTRVMCEACEGVTPSDQGDDDGTD